MSEEKSAWSHNGKGSWGTFWGHRWAQCREGSDPRGSWHAWMIVNDKLYEVWGGSRDEAFEKLKAAFIDRNHESFARRDVT